MSGRRITGFALKWTTSCVAMCAILAAATCGSEVSAPATSTGGTGGTGGAYEPSHCVGLDYEGCCAENVNGCLWMDFEWTATRRGGECVAEQDMCEKDRDDDCPDGFLCRTKFAEGVCDDGTSDEPMNVCYSPDEWQCPPHDSDPCTWIGD